MLTPKVTVFLALSPVSAALFFPLEPTPRFPFLGGVRKGAGGAIMSDEAFSSGDAGKASPWRGEAAFFSPRFFFFFFWDEEGDASCLRERRDRTPDRDRDQKRERCGERSQLTKEPLQRQQLG